jgi:hypothetical protein
MDFVMFDKSKLRTGMKVKLRNGQEFRVMKNTATYGNLPEGDIIIHNSGSFLYLCGYEDDLTNKINFELDIVEVFMPENVVTIASQGNDWISVWSRPSSYSFSYAVSTGCKIRPVTNFVENCPELDSFQDFCKVAFILETLKPELIRKLIDGNWFIKEDNND